MVVGRPPPVRFRYRPIPRCKVAEPRCPRKNPTQSAARRRPGLLNALDDYDGADDAAFCLWKFVTEFVFSWELFQLQYVAASWRALYAAQCWKLQERLKTGTCKPLPRLQMCMEVILCVVQVCFPKSTPLCSLLQKKEKEMLLGNRNILITLLYSIISLIEGLGILLLQKRNTYEVLSDNSSSFNWQSRIPVFPASIIFQLVGHNTGT